MQEPALDQADALATFAGSAEDQAAVDAFLKGVLPAEGDTVELNAALPALYAELRELAASYLRKERPNHTLQPTALVHESYLRLVSQHSVDWGNRLQFLSIAARMMRRILANHAIARKRDKRDSGEPLLELDAAVDFHDRTQLSMTRLEDALRDLERLDPRQARVVELRFFGGLTMEETAELLGVSPVTVKRDWVTARQWLQREIGAAA
ncbi:MAG: ECF-type sigma factor [Verrucomicrobiota bacterium]|nr:ECF-type sigma factor [Verrucomicrobiota bacterium]